MSWYKRKEISIAITAIAIIVFLLDWNLDIPILRATTDQLTNWGTVIAAFAIGLGFINMFQNYGKKIAKRRPGWYYAAWFILLTSITSIIGVIQGNSGDISSYIYNNVYSPLSATFYSIALFYMASAAYKSFRFKSIESSLLLISAFIVLLKNAPIGAIIWGGFDPIGTFILNYPTMGVSRGIGISITLAAVALALRVMTGKEYGFLAGTSEK